VKLDTKTGAIITLVICGGIYGLMLAKGQKPPAGLDQVLIAAAATLFVVKDAKDEAAAKKLDGK
jgi:hypothetical protein